MRRALLRLRQAAEPRDTPAAALAQALQLAGFGTERAAAAQQPRPGSPDSSGGADADERQAPDEPPGLPPSSRAPRSWAARGAEPDQGFAPVTAVRNLLGPKGPPEAMPQGLKPRAAASGRQLGPKAARAVAPQARRGEGGPEPRGARLPAALRGKAQPEVDACMLEW
jgi:hypothetical protein